MTLKSLITASALAGALFVTTATTSAGQVSVEQNQELSADAETDSSVNCVSTGSYGQMSCTASSSANASSEGSQEQRVNIDADTITLSNGQVIYRHSVANTALDANTIAAAVGTMLTGAAGMALKLTNRA